jgi:hypothetical protein
MKSLAKELGKILLLSLMFWSAVTLLFVLALFEVAAPLLRRSAPTPPRTDEGGWGDQPRPPGLCNYYFS